MLEPVREAADRFGSQCVVLSVDARRSSAMPSGFEVTTHGGRQAIGGLAADELGGDHRS